MATHEYVGNDQSISIRYVSNICILILPHVHFSKSKQGFSSDNWPRIDQALMWMAFSNHGRFGGCWLLKLTHSSYLIPTLVGVLLRLAKDVPFISLRVGPQMWRVPKGKIKARMEAAHTLDKHKQKIQYPPQKYWSLKRYASSWLMSCRNQSSGCCVTQLTSLTSHHFIVCHISNISSFVTLEPFHAYESNQFWWLQHWSFRHIIARRNFLDTFRGARVDRWRMVVFLIRSRWCMSKKARADAVEEQNPYSSQQMIARDLRTESP